MQDASDAAQSAMVSIIGLDSEKVQQLCDAANEEVDEASKVQIANFLCPVSLYECLSFCILLPFSFPPMYKILCLIIIMLVSFDLGKLCGFWRSERS